MSCIHVNPLLLWQTALFRKVIFSSWSRSCRIQLFKVLLVFDDVFVPLNSYYHSHFIFYTRAWTSNLWLLGALHWCQPLPFSPRTHLLTDEITFFCRSKREREQLAFSEPIVFVIVVVVSLTILASLLIKSSMWVTL